MGNCTGTGTKRTVIGVARSDDPGLVAAHFPGIFLKIMAFKCLDNRVDQQGPLQECSIVVAGLQGIIKVGRYDHRGIIGYGDAETGCRVAGNIQYTQIDCWADAQPGGVGAELAAGNRAAAVSVVFVADSNGDGFPALQALVVIAKLKIIDLEIIGKQFGGLQGYGNSCCKRLILIELNLQRKQHHLAVCHIIQYSKGKCCNFLKRFTGRQVAKNFGIIRNKHIFIGGAERG